jgi:hypothetical protein
VLINTFGTPNKKEAIGVMKHRTKVRLVLIVPILLALGLLYYLSSPQYAMKRFVVALESHDTKTAKSFCTANFILLESPAPGDLINPENLEHHIGMGHLLDRLQDPYAVVWKQSGFNNAVVTYELGFKGEEGYYRFFLMKTPQGWKVYKWEGGFW